MKTLKPIKFKLIRDTLETPRCKGCKNSTKLSAAANTSANSPNVLQLPFCKCKEQQTVSLQCAADESTPLWKLPKCLL